MIAMPRRKRSEIAKQNKPEPKQVQSDDSDISWVTYEQPRFWCPVCGTCADLDVIESAPHTLHMAMQRYGGSRPGYIEKHGRLKRDGYMQYYDLPESDTRVLAAQLIPILEDTIAYLRDLAGNVVEQPLPPIMKSSKLPQFKIPGGLDRDELDALEEQDLDEEFAEIDAMLPLTGPEPRPALTGRSGSRALPAPRSERPALPETKVKTKALPGKKSETKRVGGKNDQKALPPPRE